MISSNTIKYRVNYIGRGMYRCVFEYEMKDGERMSFVQFGKSHRDAINSALENYKNMVLIGI